MKLLTKMYQQSKYKADVYEKMKEFDCEKELIGFVEDQMYAEDFPWVKRTMMDEFVYMDKARADSVLHLVFKKEFAYWQNFHKNNPEDKWWSRKNPNYMRFTFFWRLVSATIYHELYAWEEKGNSVIDYFRDLENYGRTDGFQRIDKRVEYLFDLKEKELLPVHD